jgi:hypothetical protein
MGKVKYDNKTDLELDFLQTIFPEREESYDQWSASGQYIMNVAILTSDAILLVGGWKHNQSPLST